MDTKKKYIA